MTIQAAEMIPTRVVSSDGTPLFLRWWLPDGAVRGAIQIAHDLAEDSSRYADFASSVANAGWAVYAHDQRGHGFAASDAAERCHLGDEHGWKKCLDDLRAVHRHLLESHSHIPIVLLGQGMGALLAQQLTTDLDTQLAGVVLSSPYAAPSASFAWIAWLERLRLGRRGRSPYLESKLRGAPFTDLPLGIHPTVATLAEFSRALRDSARRSLRFRVPRNLSVLVVSGQQDARGRNGREADRVAASYRDAGLERVTQRTYPRGAHDLLHASGRDDVTRDVVEWLGALPKRRIGARRYMSVYVAPGLPYESLRLAADD